MRKYFKISFIFLILFVFGVNVFAAKVVDIKGKAQIKKANTEQWKELKVNDIVEENDSIMTGINSEVKIDFGYAQSTVNQLTTIEIKENRIVNKKSMTNILLLLGNIKTKVVKEKGKTDFRVTTPVAVAGVRGSIQNVVFSPDFGMNVKMEQGYGFFQNKLGRKENIQQGEESEVKKNGELVPVHIKEQEKVFTDITNTGLTEEEKENIFIFTEPDKEPPSSLEGSGMDVRKEQQNIEDIFIKNYLTDILNDIRSDSTTD